MSAFDRGDSSQFFNLWTAHIPDLLKKEDITCAKLEFYLHMYFAVRPMHPHAPRSEVASPAILCSLTGCVERGVHGALSALS